MELSKIIELAEKSNLPDMYELPKWVLWVDGKVRFIKSNKLSSHGSNLVKFTKMVEKEIQQ